MTRDELYREVVRERYGPPPTHEAHATPSPAPRPPAPPIRAQLVRTARRHRLAAEQIDALLRMPPDRAAQILAVRERRAR